MIVRLTHGATRVTLHIEDKAGLQPHIPLTEAKTEPPSPLARSGSVLPRTLTLAAVGLFCAFAGYRFAPGPGDHAIAKPAYAKLDPLPSSEGPHSPEPASVPAQLAHELASRPVIMPSVPPSAHASPADGNSFGLD